MTTRHVTYKPALLRKAETWVVEGEVLRGPKQTLDLRDVVDLGVIEHVIKGSRIRRMELITKSTRVMLGLTQSAYLPAEDPDRAAHRNLCCFIGQVLAEISPDLMVSIGARGGARWGMFLVGLGALLLGLGLGVAMVITGISGDRMAAAAVPMLALILIGGMTLRSHVPWRQVPKVPISTLPALLEALDGVGSDHRDDPTRGRGRCPLLSLAAQFTPRKYFSER